MKRSERHTRTATALLPMALLLVATALATSGAMATPTASTVAPPPVGAAEQVVAFVNVNVVSMDPDDPAVQRRMTVVVEDGTITAVGRSRNVDVPDGAEVVNGRGKYLLPGLNDMHFHIRHIRGLPEKFTAADVYTILLANGVTGIFDPWGFPQAFRWRRQLERGRLVGPRFRFSSPGIDEEEYADLDAIEADIRRWARRGYEWIKSHDVRTEAALDRIFETADDVGVPVIGHALRPGFPIGATLDRMPLMIAHVEEILATTPHTPTDYEERFEAAVAEVADADAWVTSTLVTYQVIAATVDDELFAELPDAPGMEYLPPTVSMLWTTQNPYRDPGFLQDRDHWLQELRTKQYIVERLREEGRVDRILLGTDSGGPPFVIPGASIHDELRLLERAGLSSLEAIRAATRNPAVFFGELDEAGTVAVGKRGDLILVNRNPTRRVKNLTRLAGTLVRGVWLSRDVLDERLDELEQRWVEDE